MKNSQTVRFRFTGVGLRANIAPTVWFFAIGTLRIGFINVCTTVAIERPANALKPESALADSVTVEFRGKFAVPNRNYMACAP